MSTDTNTSLAETKEHEKKWEKDMPKLAEIVKKGEDENKKAHS